VTYQQLLEAFFTAHNPTQLNRQGPDHGTQYRSVIFYHSPGQRQAAEEMIARLTAEHKFSQPIVTQVVPAETFWPAEEYHQKYLEKRGAVSCHI
jgi:peptide-methionine (S)-S-oxide reductase